jgi:hypothetical protein
MEKIWIYYFRLIAFSAFVNVSLNGDVCAQAASSEMAKPEIKSVTVDVEMSIKDGNTADARQLSQKMAFEKAVEQLLPGNLDPKIRAEKIRSAGSYIKTFRVLEEKQEGQVLKLKYQCDLMPILTAQPTTAPTVDASSTISSTQNGLTQFEVSWKASEFRLNSLELMQYIADSMKTRVDSFKLGRGSLLLVLETKTSPGEARMMLSQYLGPKVNVKVAEGLPTSESAVAPVLPPGPPSPPQPLRPPPSELPPRMQNSDGLQKN